jgi:hypothetical protein
MATDNTFGAAGTDLSQLPQGALGALGGSDTLQRAFDLANIMTPKAQKFDPALAALLYFTEMGKQASQPGATLLGSVVGSGQAPAAYMMKQAEAAREREAGIGKTAVQLAGVLSKEPAQSTAYTNTTTGKIDYFTPRQFQALDPAQRDALVPYSKEAAPKTVGSGVLLTYMTPEDAETFLLGQGLTKENENFGRLVKRLTVPSDEDPEVTADLLGQPIALGGTFLVGTPLIMGGEVKNLQIGPATGAAAPRFTKYSEDRLAVIAKVKGDNLAKVNGMLEQIDQAKALLMGGARTGLDQQILAPFKKLAVGLFGAEIPGLRDFENLESISFAIAPGMRPPASGSTSDMEFTAYQRASLYMGNTAEANYINLYALGKRAEAANKLADLEEELLMSEKYRDTRLINKKLREQDPGIFEVYKGDLNDVGAIKTWYDSLDDGAVVNNGNGALDIINSSSGERATYVIKGWKN